ncbi:MAG TPA: hypothetical protein VJ343_00160 [archaeon]|nr:hypothetical protein [archaeon]
MLRSDLEIIHAFRRNLEWNGTFPSGRLRGTITFDSAQEALTHADGQLIGVLNSIPVYREGDLGNGKFIYYDFAGNTLATNV